MYSTWGYYAPVRAMFDCGEGAATALGNYIYAPEVIFLSHSHGDHVLGLPSFIGCRNSARGDKEKPLSVYYSPTDTMADLIAFIKKRNSNLSYDCNFIPLQSGAIWSGSNGMRIEAFNVKHCYGSLGYKVLEKRTRLKAGINPNEVKNLISKGVNVSEEYWANVFTWTLDSASYDVNHIQNCAWLVADATFLKSADRDDPTHSSVEEILFEAKAANVKRLTLAHFSSRYNWSEIPKFVLDQAAKVGFNGKIDVVLPNKVYEL